MENRGTPLPGYEAGASRAEMAVIPAPLFWAQILRERASAITAVRTSPSAANIQAWEEEVASLNTILAVANRQRNTYSKSCSLPPELLSRTFEELAAISPIGAAAGRGWIVVIHVCQHWRNVAKTNSSLWNNVTFLSVSLWDLFIACARDRPLTVSGNISAELKSSGDFSGLVPTCIRRIKELNLQILPSTDSDNCLARSRFTALLEKLASSRESLNVLEVLSLKPSGSIGRGVSVDFIKHRAISLRRVTLQGIIFPLGMNTPNITFLELIDTTHWSVDILLETLGTLPCLEDLTLDRVCIAATGTLTQPPVNLARVRRLIIKNTLSICVAFLKSVNVHPLAYKEIDASVTDHLHDDDLNGLGHALLSSEQFEPTVLELTSYDDRAICTVAAYCDGEEAGLYGPCNSHHSTPSYAHPWPSVKITLPVPVSLLEPSCALAPVVMLHVLSQTRKASWESITFEGHMHWNPELVLETFGDATSVETLIISTAPTDSVSAFCKALVASSISLDSESPLFPALEVFHFSSIKFGCPADECNGGHSAIHYLTDVLIDRCRTGKPITYLTLDECSVGDDYVDEWSSYVLDVEWDGESWGAHERHTDDEEDEEGDGEGEEVPV